MSNRKRLVLVIIAAAIVLAAIVGFVIGAVNAGGGDLEPEPGTSSGPLAPKPTDSPSSEAVEESLTPQGWLEEPDTRDFKTYGELAARAVWYYDSRETTSKKTIEHIADWVGKTPPFKGTVSYRPLALRRLALLVPGTDAFNEQRKRSMWVTGKTIGTTKVDLDHRDLAANSGAVQPTIDFGFHTVTSTVEITYHFTGSNGVEQTETDEHLQTVTVFCPEAERCRVLEWTKEPVF